MAGTGKARGRVREQATEAAGAKCGCDTAAQTGRAAVAVDPEIKRINLAHLRRIEGQVGGVIRMVEAERSCADIITQVAAARESLLAVARNLMRNHLTHCARAALARGGTESDEMTEELLDLISRVAR